MSVEYETFKDGGVKYFLMKLASKVSGLFVAKTGDTMSGNLETSADLKFTVKSKGLYGIDHGNNSYPMMRDNGTNLWIGATQTSAQHHIGGVYVSSGYDQTNSRGYETIYVSVPNATNTGATNRKVWHNGNLTKLSQLTNDGDGTQGSTFALAADLPGQATDSNLGLVKLNPNESVDVNANGQITVGGRLGQYPNGGGLYYPTNIQPENVAANCLLLTEATTVGLTANRTFALAGGANVTLKSSAAAGSTTYYVNNTFANRFTCAMAYGGYAAIDQSGAGTLCVKVTAVYYENDTTKARLVPHSGATESNNRIVIETETSVNPDAATTKLRLYGSMKYDSSVHIGQGIGTGGVSGKGKLLQVGQSQTALDGNTIMVGNSIFTSMNRCALFGANHINMVQGAFMGGEGHDSTNGTFVGLGAIGKYSQINADTAFAIGNGTANTARNNLFEITDDGGVIVPSSTSGSTKKFKITVDDTGTITATEV